VNCDRDASRRCQRVHPRRTRRARHPSCCATAAVSPQRRRPQSEHAAGMSLRVVWRAGIGPQLILARWCRSLSHPVACTRDLLTEPPPHSGRSAQGFYDIRGGRTLPMPSASVAACREAGRRSARAAFSARVARGRGLTGELLRLRVQRDVRKLRQLVLEIRAPRPALARALTDSSVTRPVATVAARAARTRLECVPDGRLSHP